MICKCANVLQFAGVAIKGELSPPSDICAQSSVLKRRRSDGSEGMGEKRQRVDPNLPLQKNIDPFTALLARTTADVAQQFARQQSPPANGPQNQSQQLDAQHYNKGQPAISDGLAIQSALSSLWATYDPHHEMCISSLPVLESLVRTKQLLRR